MIELALCLLAIPVLFAIAEWRLGLMLALMIALLQDPLRKITPDQPVLFVAFAAIVFAGACLGALLRGVPLMPNSIFEGERQIKLTMSLLLVLIILQAFNSFVHFGNPMITLIGLLTYLLPVPSIVFAYQLVLRAGEARVHQFMKTYVLCTTLALITVYLGYAGYNSQLLKSVGPTFMIYDANLGKVVVPQSGIFRASEIAAWHAAACASFVILLATLGKINGVRLSFATVMVVLLVAIGVLTGRRKVLIEVVVFAGTYFIVWAILQKGIKKLGIGLVAAGLAGFAWMVQVSDVADVGNVSSDYSIYVDRAKTVFGDAPSRFVELGLGPVMWAYEGFGPFGAGLGVGSQGTQYFGGGGWMAGAAEGGLGKIMLELGIPGLFFDGVPWILAFRHLWRIMRVASKISPRIARLSFGLFSFLVANVAAFSVATQAFGDLFILLTLSWTLGFLLAIPALLGREVRAQESAVLLKSTPAFA